eukprot:GHRR01017440.1.p1 GENE.GHRR01017440.1~~GHRR01017440.1.p1  ORF type:complete len:131 (+),score=12.77 GHRR01017440.1:405-797(+)
MRWNTHALCGSNRLCLSVVSSGTAEPLPRFSFWHRQTTSTLSFWLHRFPKYIHQTVKDKSKLSCQARKAIDSWKALNPGYTYKLWDDDDIKDFMVKFYPGLVPVPFDEFLTGTERSDLWRILVLHQVIIS